MSVPWRVVERHRAQIEHNHGQTLERLAVRGGLDAVELVGAMKGMNIWQGTLLKFDACEAYLRRHAS